MLEGIITKINSNIYMVKVDNNYIECKSRGLFRYNKLTPFVGDQVKVDVDKKIITEILERKNYLNRPPVANIDVALIVTSIVKPDINYTLLDKLISIVTINKIEPVIVFTKLDISDKISLKKIKSISKYYESIGIKVFNNKKISKLKKYLKGKLVTVCGQTGAGKSTLINKFNKELKLATKEISMALGRGVHTTRIVEIHELKDFNIVDTPGFSQIDINIYNNEDIKNSFREFHNINCAFKDCKHIKEKGCVVKDLVNNGTILKSRYDNYLKFIEESK